MSGSNRQVRLESFALAELTVLDGKFDCVGRGCPPLDVSLQPGLYLADARIGARRHEHYFAIHETGDPIRVYAPAPPIDSPLCWGQAADHTGIPWRGFAPAASPPSGMASLTLQLRLPQSPSDDGAALLARFRLLDAEHRLLAAFGTPTNEHTRIEQTVVVPPGPCWLAFGEAGSGTGVAAYAVAGLALRCVVALDPDAPDGVPPVLTWFYHWEGARGVWTEALRAILDSRARLPDSARLVKWLNQGRADPMAQLYAGHLLAREPKRTDVDRHRLVDTIMARLGPDHPDVYALAHALLPSFARYDGWRCNGLPMLSASWDVLVNHPAAAAGAALPPGARHIHGSGTALTWTLTARDFERLPPTLPPRTKPTEPDLVFGPLERPENDVIGRPFPSPLAQSTPTQDSGSVFTGPTSAEHTIRIGAALPGLSHMVQNSWLSSVVGPIGTIASNALPRESSARGTADEPNINLPAELAQRVRILLTDATVAARLRSLLTQRTSALLEDGVVRNLLSVLLALLDKPALIAQVDERYIGRLQRSLGLPPQYLADALRQIGELALTKAAETAVSALGNIDYESLLGRTLPVMKPILNFARAATNSVDRTRLADRSGYNADFLLGHAIPLPSLLTPPTERHSNVDGTLAVLLHYQHFSVALHRERRLCLFSAANINGPHRVAIGEQGPARLDPRLAEDSQPKLDAAGLYWPLTQAGHVAWGAPAVAAQAGGDTLYMPNLVPISAPLVDSPWAGLEDAALAHAQYLTVISGPVLNTTEAAPSALQQPLALWKVIGFVGLNGKLQAHAFTVDWDAGEPVVRRIQIKAIEQMTGLRFPILRDADQVNVAADIVTLDQLNW